MIIGVHAKALSERNPTGVAKYTRKLLDHMLILPEAREHNFLLYVDSPVKYQIPNTRYQILHSTILWTQLRLALELWCHKPDVLFVPQHVLPKTAPKRSVVTIHGLEFERFPQFYPWHERMYLRYVTKDAVKCAAQIIAVSQATKNDLTELYRVPEEKITVVYHGAPTPSAQFPISNFQFPNDSGAPYFLYIGRIELKKNVDGIIRAFAIAKEKYKLPHKLMLAGGDGYGAAAVRLTIYDLRLTEHVALLGYITEEEKWHLLRNAAAFIFPSWYEGFGLPILEAQAAGVPVITSNTSAMFEVAGLGALLADPADSESIAEAMHRITTDPSLRTVLVASGRENIKRFSWEKCARETLEVLMIS